MFGVGIEEGNVCGLRIREPHFKSHVCKVEPEPQVVTEALCLRPTLKCPTLDDQSQLQKLSPESPLLN